MSRKTKAILATIAAAVVVVLVIFGHEPGFDTSDDCPAKGIDPQTRKEGTCMDDGSKNVVVDFGHELQISSLTARLIAIRQRTTLGARGDRRRAKGVFVTFELALGNRTGGTARVEPDQFVLNLQRRYYPRVADERIYEHRSLTTSRSTLAPGATVTGTLTFEIPSKQVQVMRREGNLDIANFFFTGGDYEPESAFREETGVIRTYGGPTG